MIKAIVNLFKKKEVPKEVPKTYYITTEGYKGLDPENKTVEFYGFKDGSSRWRVGDFLVMRRKDNSLTRYCMQKVSVHRDQYSVIAEFSPLRSKKGKAGTPT